MSFIGSLNVDIQSILDTKSLSTVRDVFVYDTSQDSDGGAWRKRTQHTSWYQETLNTSTRGSRREFPAVAVIVAQFNRVTIYDGDDPDLPMWMVFNSGGAQPNWNYLISGDLKSVFAKNGVICVGRFSLLSFNFLEDSVFYFTNVARYNWGGAGLSSRNAGLFWGSDLGAPYIVAQDINDVAMTILPDAPVDPATGLPVPTIAVATDGGVSVINNDGTVADSSTTEKHNAVDFNEQGHLLYQDVIFNKTNRVAFPENYQSDGFTGEIVFGNVQIPLHLRMSREGVFTDISQIVYRSGSTLGVNSLRGLQYISFDIEGGRSASMTSYTTSTYTTGWMHGDVKGAFLSDTDDTDLVGSGELVTNGTFDTDVSGWNATSATISNDAGRLKVETNSETFGYAYQTITTVVGQTYTLYYDYDSSETTDVLIGTTTIGGQNTNGKDNSPGSGTTSETFVATNTTTYITFRVQGNAAGKIAYFDNVSVKLADADRSVNNNGLIVNGTVTRTPVASGADLVAYSGFSA